MTIGDQNTYSISTVSKMTGVTDKKLRYWEEKKLIPKPFRNRCGDIEYRRYNDKHLEIISMIQKLLGEGYTLQTSSKKALNEIS